MLDVIKCIKILYSWVPMYYSKVFLNRFITIFLILTCFIIVSCGSSSTSSSSTEPVLTVTGSGSSSSSSSLTASSSDLWLTTPSAIKIKVYKVSVSTSALCTNPITVFEETDPEYFDFLTNPTFGSGSIDAGTYPCVMVEFSDFLLVTPVANDGALCVAGTEFTADVCKTSFGLTFQLIDGTTGTCSDGEQKIASYYSTASANSTTGGGTSVNPFLPPDSESDSDNGLNISALELTADTTKTLVLDATDKINGTDFSECVLEAPELLFE